MTCVKMNATEDANWLDMPSVLDATVERLKAVKALGLNAGLDFHGRLHRPMAKQLAKALEPHRPLFIEEPILVEHPEALKQLSDMTSIPIALGERLYHRWDAKRFFEDGFGSSFGSRQNGCGLTVGPGLTTSCSENTKETNLTS